MHECIKKLLADLETPEEEDIESLCRLLLTVGQQMESTSKDAHGHMDVYFMRLQAIVDKKAVSSRLVFMILVSCITWVASISMPC
jgi:translation initiation factor 4G